MISILARTLLLLTVFFVATVQAKEAEQVFKEYNSALVQIKSINIESGQKSSIGTGFFTDQQGLIVSNYHVVSSFVQEPNKYRLEFIDQQEQSFPVGVVAVDVINDLALLKAEQAPAIQFNLAQAAPIKGEKLFALGNPHDLGMIVVPGTYNGIKQNSFYQRIHFTGSINPGMSGGPTVDKKGLVVGINVATAGNQIGFLVPVAKLWALLNRYNSKASDADLIADIRQQLVDNQQNLYAELLNSDWQISELGDASVPNQIAKIMPCWGDSNKQKNNVLHTQASANCSLGESVYLSNHFSTGYAQLGFSWIQSQKLSQMQLAQLYEVTLNSRYGNNNASADDVSNYHCSESLIENSQQATIKGVTCVRAYRKYADLFDVKFKSVMMGKDNQALVAKYMLQGITADTANAFNHKFLEQLSWN